MTVPRTARAIAALGIPGLPGTERGIQLLAARDGWAYIDRPGRGGGRLWLLPLELEALAQAAEARQHHHHDHPHDEDGQTPEHVTDRLNARRSVAALRPAAAPCVSPPDAGAGGPLPTTTRAARPASPCPIPPLPNTSPPGGGEQTAPAAAAGPAAIVAVEAPGAVFLPPAAPVVPLSHLGSAPTPSRSSPAPVALVERSDPARQGRGESQRRAPGGTSHTAAQLRCRDARLVLVREIERQAAHSGGVEAAIAELVTRAANGLLPPHLEAAVSAANARRGAGRTLSAPSLRRWRAAAKNDPNSLIPIAGRPEAQSPPWAEPLLRLWRRPAKPALAAVLDVLPQHLPPGLSSPSYSQALRFVAGLSAIERSRGREGPRELLSRKTYVKRRFEHLDPAQIYTADGKTFDAEVEHPMRGQPFRPEITTILDVATRRVVGWSAGLAESAQAVADALRHSFETNGVCDVLYPDRGCGYVNQGLKDEVTGLAARLGFVVTHSLPYRSQARGAIERLNGSLWSRAAKSLPTYMGRDMDKEARQKVFKIVRGDLATVGVSRHLMPWTNFVTWCQAQVDRYNARPHRSLPKVTDATGRRRHLSPDELWAAKRERMQVLPEILGPDDARDLFRPHELRQPSRGRVRIMGAAYLLPALEDYDAPVMVAYDLHDTSRVWCREADTGRLIGIATLDVGVDYLPQSMLERARDKRLAGRLARLDRHRAAAIAEADPALIITPAPAPTPMTPAELASMAEVEALLASPPPSPPIEEELAWDDRAQALAATEAAGIALSADDGAFLDWARDQFWFGKRQRDQALFDAFEADCQRRAVGE